MHDTLTISISCIVGFFLGVFFFGGLWWTVRKAISTPRPALWFIGSLLLRMSLVLVGFLLVGDGQWQRLLGCLLGFILARFGVVWLTRPPIVPQPTRTKEISHAP